MHAIDASSRSEIAAARQPARMDGVVVVIPARNEEQSLPLVLRDLPGVEAVVVVNNGSSDATSTVAARMGAVVVDEPQRGYGSACLRGLSEVERLHTTGAIQPTIVAFLDADYSDHPDLLPEFIEPIRSGRADFVIGSRLTGCLEPGAMPAQSVYGNRLACALIHFLWGVRYSDLGPFRAIRYDVLRNLRMSDRNFGWTIEMQVKAAVIRARILEIPVPYRRRIGTSKISGTWGGSIRAGAKILYTIAKYAWHTPLLASPPRRQRIAS
ncbi:MAG: glycosyltransferase family 2 protein [Pirellulales bacterium]